MRFEVLESRPMTSRPDVGLVRSRWDVLNEQGEEVLTVGGWSMFGRRPAAAMPTHRRAQVGARRSTRVDQRT